MKKLLSLLIVLFLVSPALAADSQTVVMNIKTYIYHSPDCKWAKKCTKNCIKTTKQKAQLKEKGLVKFAVGRRLAIYLCSVNKFINYI